MLTRRNWLSGVAGGVLGLWCGGEAGADPGRELFTLGRSKNANVLKYAVRTLPGGGLDPRAPIEAYWCMLAEDGRREELTWTERRLAYGFLVSAVKRDSLLLRLTACGARPLVVRAAGAGYQAELKIGGQLAALRRIFVQTEGGLVIPTVRFVELTGVTGAGQRVSERIV